MVVIMVTKQDRILFYLYQYATERNVQNKMRIIVTY